MTKLKSYFIVLLISLIATFSVYQLAFMQNLISKIEFLTYDLRLLWKNTGENDSKINDIVIISIDERSIEKLGRFSSWPLDYYASIINKMNQGGALITAFDVFFTESDSLSNDIANIYYKKVKSISKIDSTNFFKLISSFNTENEFKNALDNYGRAILSAFDNINNHSNSKIELNNKFLKLNATNYNYLPDFNKIDSPVLPISSLLNSSLSAGFAHITPDKDGTSRNYELLYKYDNYLTSNFSFQVVKLAFGIDSIEIKKNTINLYSESELISKIPIDQDGKTLLNFYGKKFKFRYISFSDVLQGRIDPSFFKDKIVLVGAAAVGLHDFKKTPLDINYPGVELHATFIKNVLDNNFITRSSEYETYLIWFFFLAIILTLFLKLKIIHTVLIYISLIPLIFFVSYQIFVSYSYLINTGIIYYYLTFSYLILLYYRYTSEFKEKQKIKNAFSKYVATSVVDEILENPKKLKLSGELKYVTALFTDIKDFTVISEKVNPVELTDFLKYYMTKQTEIVLKNKGMLDKYIGDAIVALFGAPLPIENHAAAACLTAIELTKKEKDISEKYSYNPHLKKLYTRIGINTGEIIIGNMGSEQLFDYTGIGDQMNLASRLESLNKYYGTQIIIAEETRKYLNDDFIAREIDYVSVKGKEQGIKIYQLIDHKNNLTDIEIENKLKLVNMFDSALKYYYSGDWETAIKQFRSIKELYNDDIVTEVLLNRSINLSEKNLKDWNGLWVMESK